MPAFKDIQLSLEELQELVVSQHARIAELEELVALLRAENERLIRGGKRQAAPFSKGTRKANPKKPGRNPGSGPFAYRTAPAMEDITGPVIEVPVIPSVCPTCGGGLEPRAAEMATITDLPEVVRPSIRAYRVGVCRCVECGKSVRGSHPNLAPDQHGATAHRVGRRVMAAAHALHYGSGVPVRQVPFILKQLCGILLTQGAITQDSQRQAQGALGQAYEQLRQSVRYSNKVHTDDTGWKVAGDAAHLMVFETDETTVFQIRPQHRNDEVQEVVPSDYQGVMSTDRGRSYDAKQLLALQQQKCMSHIQRSITAVVERKTGEDRRFGEELQALLKGAVQSWHSYHEGPKSGSKMLLKTILFRSKAGKLKSRVTYHLRDRQLLDSDNQRLLNELGRHHDQGNLLRFLDNPEIEPTNNRAERALRPAVIARKVSQCSKTWPGAHAHAAFLSVICTLKKRPAEPLLDALVRVMDTGQILCSSP